MIVASDQSDILIADDLMSKLVMGCEELPRQNTPVLLS